MLHKIKQLLEFWQTRKTKANQAVGNKFLKPKSILLSLSVIQSIIDSILLTRLNPNYLALGAKQNLVCECEKRKRGEKKKCTSACAKTETCQKKKQKKQRMKRRNITSNTAYLPLHHQLFGEQHGLVAEGLSHLHPSGCVSGTAWTFDTWPRTTQVRALNVGTRVNHKDRV